MKKIKIPNLWRPRKYQLKLWKYLENGGKRAVAVWHRRAGKDSLALNWTAVAAFERVGVYWHMLPLQTQARKVVWDAIDKQGRRVIDQVFPPELANPVPFATKHRLSNGYFIVSEPPTVSAFVYSILRFRKFTSLNPTLSATKLTIFFTLPN